MTTILDPSAGSVPSGVSFNRDGTTVINFTANGTTQSGPDNILQAADGYIPGWLVAIVSIVPSPLSNAIVLSPNSIIGDVVEVYAIGGNVQVFPYSGGKIGNLATNAGITVVPGQGRIFRYVKDNDIWEVQGIGFSEPSPPPAPYVPPITSIASFTPSGTTQGSGTTIGTSPASTTIIALVPATNSNRSVKLPASPTVGDVVEVYPIGDYPAYVFPQSGGNIGGRSANIGVYVEENNGAVFRYTSSNTWRVYGNIGFIE